MCTYSASHSVLTIITIDLYCCGVRWLLYSGTQDTSVWLLFSLFFLSFYRVFVNTRQVCLRIVQTYVIEYQSRVMNIKRNMTAFFSGLFVRSENMLTFEMCYTFNITQQNRLISNNTFVECLLLQIQPSVETTAAHQTTNTQKCHHRSAAARNAHKQKPSQHAGMSLIRGNVPMFHSRAYAASHFPRRRMRQHRQQPHWRLAAAAVTASHLCKLSETDFTLMIAVYEKCGAYVFYATRPKY